MPTLLITADRRNAAFGHRAEALRKYAPDPWEVDTVYYDHTRLEEICFDRYDAVFVLPEPIIPRIRQHFRLRDVRAPLIASHNSGLGRRREMLLDCLLSADWTIINNYPAWAEAKATMIPERFTASHVPNGVDTSFWRELVPWSERPNRWLWVATKEKTEEEFVYPAEDGKPEWRADVKGWSDIGDPICEILNNMGAETDFKILDQSNLMTPDEMLQWYNSGRYFVVTSHAEGTPNTMLEAAACGCAILATPTGNAPELIDSGVNGLVYPATLLWLVRGVKQALAEGDAWAEKMKPRIAEWSWEKRAPEFFRVFERVISRV